MAEYEYGWCKLEGGGPWKVGHSRYIILCQKYGILFSVLYSTHQRA